MNSRQSRSALRRLLLACGLVAIAGCGSPALEPSSPTGSAPVASVEASRAPVGVFDPATVLAGLLDPASRDLLGQVDPTESIEATITTPHTTDLTALARSRGFIAEDVSNDQVLVVGPMPLVIALIDAVHPVLVVLTDDTRAERPLPAVQPVVSIPAPGTPYADHLLQIDLTAVVIPPERQNPMLRRLASLIVTIDGQPYDRLVANGECDPSTGPGCDLRVSGFVRGAGHGSDDVTIRADRSTSWIPQLVDTTQLSSVPRPLIRAAEWIARHDPAAAAAIHGYTSCCGATWFPAQPGIIQLTYVRRCLEGAASAGVDLARAGGDVADTGCEQGMLIRVDLRDGSVVAIDEDRR